MKKRIAIVAVISTHRDAYGYNVGSSTTSTDIFGNTVSSHSSSSLSTSIWAY